jgi:curved DNA-binding protein CbpA
MTRLIHSHYENLKVARDAPPEVIRAAYRALVRRYHPDLNPSSEAARVMAILNRAMDVLGHPESRAEHDLWIAESEQAARLRLQQSAQSPTHAIALRPARPVTVQNHRARPRQPVPPPRRQPVRQISIVPSERFAKVMVAMLAAIAVAIGGVFIVGLE